MENEKLIKEMKFQKSNGISWLSNGSQFGLYSLNKFLYTKVVSLELVMCGFLESKSNFF